MTIEDSGEFLWTFTVGEVECCDENRPERPAASIGVSTRSPRPPLLAGVFCFSFERDGKETR